MAAAAAGWICLFTALLASAEAHDHSGETDSFHVSVGHLFLLRCYSADVHSEVIWSREDSSSLPGGVELRDGLLWFLPVQTSHNGSYTCETRDETGSLRRMNFEVLVSSERCPDPPETRVIQEGMSGVVPCKQTEIFRLNNTRNVRWMKDCQPVQREGESVSVDERGDMMLPEASESDAGKYSCLVEVSLDGRTYTAARSIQLNISDPVNLGTVQVQTPKQKVVMVTVGQRAELKCSAYTGFAEDDETLMYWTVDGFYTQDFEELSESWKYVHRRGKVYAESVLSISKVLRQFLNVPIKCYVMNPDGEDVGVAWLQEADYSALYMSVSAFLVALVLAASFLFFKVDLVLAYRKLLRYFPKQQVPDRKLYDAYVSFLHPDSLSADVTASFALNILPEQLEEQHGYSLYIRGRDDCPGEAMHDAVAATVPQCRRLIIILSGDGKTREASPLHEKQNQLCYEQKVGLYDALTQNDPRVILVEIDGPVDYSLLPESLQYIKRKQGALKWQKAFLGTNKLTKLRSNRSFWKNLRYHMPSVPAGKLQTIV